MPDWLICKLCGDKINEKGLTHFKEEHPETFEEIVEEAGE